MGASSYDLGKAAIASDNRVAIQLVDKLQKSEKQRFLEKGFSYTFPEFMQFFGEEASRRWEQAPVRETGKMPASTQCRTFATLCLSDLPQSLRGAEHRIRSALGDGEITSVECVNHWSEDFSSCTVRFTERE